MTSGVGEPIDLRRAVAGLFDRSAVTYDAVGVDFFPVFARTLLDDVAPRPGQRVLDIGCGRGAVLFAAAERVGPAGTVTSFDISPAMVERTARDVELRGLGNVTVTVRDAQEPGLPAGSFDVALASCVLFFLPDPAAGLRAWHALLAPGGRLGLTAFGRNDARWSAVESVFAPYVPPALFWAMVDPASPFASTENLRRAVEAQGFADVRAVEREHPVIFAGPEQWISWSWSHGQRVFWELVPEAQRALVHEQVLAQLERLREPDGTIVMTQRVRYLTALRPG